MKSRSEDNKPNPKFYYSGHHIVKIWEQYLKNGENGIKFLVYDTNEELKDEESIFIDLSQQKEVALVLNNRSSLYKNSSNQSITLCGEIDHDSKGVENIEFALNQIKKYNQDNELKVNDHIIIFPYHVTSNHWNLGVISLNVNNDKEFNNATLSVYEPFGGSLANLTLLNYISSNTQLKDISPVKSENHIKQQSDSSACGAITAENGKDFLNKEKKSSYLSKIYTKGAKDLRKAHMDEIGSEDFNMEQNKNKNYNAKGDLDIEEKDSIIEIICKITQIDDWIKPLLFRYEEITSNSRATESENNAAKELLDVLKNFLKNIQSNLPHPIINDKGEFVDGGGNLITDLVKNMKSKNTISIGQEVLYP